MDDSTRSQIIQEIYEYATVKPLQDHEFTASQYASSAGMHVNRANQILPGLVDEGKLVRRRCPVRCPNGYREVWAYAKA